MTHSHVYCAPTFGAQTFREKNLLFEFFIYLYLETKPITVFQGIIWHMNIGIAF